MSLKRRWLVTIVALVAAGVALEVGVGAGISRYNALYGARVWLANSRSGAQLALIERMFVELEAEAEDVAHRPAVEAALAGTDFVELEAALREGLMPRLRERWLVDDAGVGRGPLAECRGAELPRARRRSIVWCGR